MHACVRACVCVVCVGVHMTCAKEIRRSDVFFYCPPPFCLGTASLTAKSAEQTRLTHHQMSDIFCLHPSVWYYRNIPDFYTGLRDLSALLWNHLSSSEM